MTRPHSKNATFSIRNYYNGALLYHKHLCQKGRDDIIKEELYQGTSKGAEDYGGQEAAGKLQKIKSFTADLIKKKSIKTPFQLLAMWSAIAQGTNRNAVAFP